MPHQAPPFPLDEDLRKLLHFSPEDGRIWLADQRMLLVHAASLNSLRHELINTIGPARTRKLMMRAGYTAGERDSLLAQKTRANSPLFDRFAAGPQLHMLEGAVQVITKAFNFNAEKNSFYCAVRWQYSWEAESHLQEHGLQETPMCWMLLGYASGYASTFFQRKILFKETQCVACGQTSCLVEGRMEHEWPDGQDMAADYSPDPILLQLNEQPSQSRVLKTPFQPADEQSFLLGKSPSFRRTVELLEKVAPTQVSVVLTGETGVGKERFARALHAMSPRASKPFIAINCAALPTELIESELFGAEKGAYTGSSATRIGRFERAHGGTLMLDELGELPMPAQAKLLRVLQTGEIERLGSMDTRVVDVRVIAATNIDLEKAVEEGRFRRDLFYRLNVYPVHIPALRERPDDIELLANYLLQKYGIMHGKQVAGLSDRALAALRHHHWPGNVRELENLIQRGLILTAANEFIEAENLFPQADDNTSNLINAKGKLVTARLEQKNINMDNYLDMMLQAGLSLSALENGLLQTSVQRSNGNLAAAARMLGMTRPQLSYRLKQGKQK
ncbi:MAG: sigma 54-interacting transcriptional regulator [Alcaligenaceae bacterium]|nr:sigma 54-interacting transcriptional regulator [Alcaligenaceae bacterium]